MWATLVRVRIPSCPWRLVTGDPEDRALVRILAHVPCGDGTAWEEAEISGAWPAALERLRDAPGASEVTVLEATPRRARVRLKVPACPLARAAAASGALPRFPLEARGGADLWLLVGERARSAAFVDDLKRAGVPSEVVSSREHRPRQAMTRHQRDLLEMAVAQGYYDVPRRVTLTELARRLGVAKSTLSEALARGERHAMEELRRGQAGRLEPAAP